MQHASNHSSATRRFDAAVIILTVLFLLNVATYLMVGNALPEGGQFVEQDNPFARLSWYPIYVAVLIMLCIHGRSATDSLVYNPLIYFLLLLSITSIGFSVAPDITTRRVFALMITVFFGVYLGVRSNSLETLRYVSIGCALAAVLQMVVIVISPDTAIHQEANAGAWRGILFEKNALGASAAISGLLFTMLIKFDTQFRFVWTGVLLLALVLLIGSQSTTSLIAYVLPTGVFLGFSLTQDRPNLRLLVMYLAIALVMTAAVTSAFFPDAFFGVLGKDATLTGRTDIWGLATSAIEKQPWTGYGYGAFWQEELGPSFIVSSQLEWIVPNAHNTWLEQGLNVGVPGIVGLALLVFWSVLRSIYIALKHEIVGPFAILIQLLIFTISESTILWSHNTFTCSLFVFASILACRPYESRRPNHLKKRRMLVPGTPVLRRA